MKLFTCKQIAEIDRLTMQLEPISSIELMERAANQAANYITMHVGHNIPLWFFAGPGNNGGDALAMARILADEGFSCTVFVASLGRTLKGDADDNLQHLINQGKAKLLLIDELIDIPEIPDNVTIIDGLFGSGLNKPIEGLAAAIVHQINRSEAKVISIDIPSGLFGEDNSANNYNTVVKADITLSFQFPKLSFLFAENCPFVGQLEVLPIGLHPKAMEQMASNYILVDKHFASGKIHRRDKFSHKGNFGHALLVAGSYGKMGAAVLAAKSCLRSGTGLLTTHIPRIGYNIMQVSVPEAMVSIDPSDEIISALPPLSQFSAIGIGPGIGQNTDTQQAINALLMVKPQKMVIDADALNILSANREWLKLLPANTILTPHPKEFERLAGPSANTFERLQKQLLFSSYYQVVTIIKGAHTCITLPDGRVYFNNSGCPGMAKAGSGDVLTGIILGLLAQNIAPADAAILGVFIHGMAGELAAQTKGEHSMIAGDITANLGKAFMRLE